LVDYTPLAYFVNIVRAALNASRYPTTPQSNALQLIRAQFSPLYPVLYPRTDFCSKKQPAAARGESEKNLVPIERISSGAPRQNAAKSAFSD